MRFRHELKRRRLFPGSPAEAAGLMKGDRIVEVNGQNVFNENHRQVCHTQRSLVQEQLQSKI